MIESQQNKKYEFNNYCTYSGCSLMVNNIYMSKRIKTQPMTADIFILAFISKNH